MLNTNHIQKNRGLAQITLALLVGFSTFALYQVCWENPFVLDDMTKIEHNPDLKVTTFKLSNFVFSYPDNITHLRVDPSRPLTYMIYWMCWQLTPNSPYVFHIVSTTIHTATAILVALITIELYWQILAVYSLFVGGAAALLFLTSPLIAGTVFYAYGLSDLLSALFILLALYPLIRFNQSSPARLALKMGFTSICFLLALATKQSSVVLAPLIVVLDVFCQRKIDRQRILVVYLPLFAIALGYLMFRQFYFHGIGDLEGKGSTVVPHEYLFFQGLMILKYLKMTFLPIGFTIDHLYFPFHFSAGAKLLGWVTVLAITSVAMWVALNQKAKPFYRWLGLGWSFFLLNLLPTSSFMPTVDMFVERRAYLPSIGLYMLVAGALAIVLTRSKLWQFMAVTVALIMAIGAQTYISLDRAEVYASTERLWQESLSHNNLNTRARTNLAVYYAATKNYEAARLLIENLLTYDSKNGGLYSKMGYIYMQPDYKNYNPEVALEYLQESLKLLPDNIFALYNAGVLLLQKGNFAEAERLLLHATALNPLMAIAHLRAGEAALGMKNKRLAISRFKRSLELDQNQVDAIMYLKQLNAL